MTLLDYNCSGSILQVPIFRRTKRINIRNHHCKDPDSCTIRTSLNDFRVLTPKQQYKAVNDESSLNARRLSLPLASTSIYEMQRVSTRIIKELRTPLL
jgi:arginyl-tRNA--protein-N-Asp/Glu arginylyltransferase